MPVVPVYQLFPVFYNEHSANFYNEHSTDFYSKHSVFFKKENKKTMLFKTTDHSDALGCDVSRLKTSRLYKLSVTLIYNG
jgi:hypothetical protein